MELDTSMATMTSTPSDVTSLRRAPILGSKTPINAAANAVRHNKNRHRFRTGRNRGNIPEIIRASVSRNAIRRCQS